MFNFAHRYAFPFGEYYTLPFWYHYGFPFWYRKCAFILVPLCAFILGALCASILIPLCASILVPPCASILGPLQYALPVGTASVAANGLRRNRQKYKSEMDKSRLKWNSQCGVLRHNPYVIQINIGANLPQRGSYLKDTTDF